MSFVINSKGERVEVDMEVEWFSQTCVLYADDVELLDCYVLNLYKGKELGVLRREPELVKQIRLTNLPTKGEIMQYMWKGAF